jgi:hypothetical protein
MVAPIIRDRVRTSTQASLRVRNDLTRRSRRSQYAFAFRGPGVPWEPDGYQLAPSDGPSSRLLLRLLRLPAESHISSISESKSGISNSTVIARALSVPHATENRCGSRGGKSPSASPHVQYHQERGDSCDRIFGRPPSILVESRSLPHNPRSPAQALPSLR